MARIFIALLFIAVTVFAVADWAVRSKTSTPGRVNRWIWLAVILLLPMVGPLTWIIVGAVTRAEEKQSGYQTPGPTKSGRPDDDPEALLDLMDRINRRRHRTRPEPRSPQSFGETSDRASDSQSDGPTGRPMADADDNGHSRNGDEGQSDPSPKQADGK